jgi:hypothetical protein
MEWSSTFRTAMRVVTFAHETETRADADFGSASRAEGCRESITDLVSSATWSFGNGLT